MVKVLLSGCCGRMGKVITGIVSEMADMEIAAGVDIVKDDSLPYPVFDSFDACSVPADVVIDFSSPKVFDAMTDYCVANKLPAVVCTTGLSDDQIRRLEEVSGQIAVLRSANMSLGVNLLIRLMKDAAPVLANAGFDVEIVEKHHHNKKDAPSGTAIALADAVNAACDSRFTYVYDRTPLFQPRDKNELGISAVRGGSIVGEHEVIFAGTDEVVTFEHTAYSRAIFAKGAVAAAAFLSRQMPGMYDMQDVISQ